MVPVVPTGMARGSRLTGARRGPGRRGPHRLARWLVLSVALAALAALAATGCKVSKEDVKNWGASKDAFRLAKVVKDADQELGVRQEAAYQLVRIERFFELEKALKASSRADARKIAADLAKRLLPRVKTEGGDPAEIVRAKDGLFSAWYFAAPELRRKIEQVLARWIVFGPHGEGGDHSIRKVLDALGRRGANLVAALVPPEHPELYQWDKKRVVSPNCLLGYFWEEAGPTVRTATARRFMKAVQKDKKLAKKNHGALLLTIGLLDKRHGVDFLRGLLAADPDVKVRAYAAAALRITAKAHPKALGNEVRDLAMKELRRVMKVLAANKEPPNPTVRRVSYIEHLLELAVLFEGDPVFEGLAPIIGAPYVGLPDPERQWLWAAVRMITVGFLMQLDPARALRLAYEKLPTEEVYPPRVLHQALGDLPVVWKKKPDQRKALLAALREGLSHESWVAKLIAVEGLGNPKLVPRPDLAGDLAALKKLTSDTTPLKGAGWQKATLGDRAKKAVEVLSKTK
jgi:hypothetical protein